MCMCHAVVDCDVVVVVVNIVRDAYNISKSEPSPCAARHTRARYKISHWVDIDLGICFLFFVFFFVCVEET